MKLIMIMPAYNEGNAIKKVLLDWTETLDAIIGKGTDDYRIIIINDGSTDNTAETVNSVNNAHITLITQPNSGHGHALYNGYMKALSMKPEWVFQTDSDGQTNPGEFRLLWERRNDSNVIMGYRKHRKDGLFRMFSTRVLRICFAACFGHFIVDSNTPFRLMKSDVLMHAMQTIGQPYDFTNILLTGVLTCQHEHIEFIETSFKPREIGVNSVNMKNMSAKGLDAIKEMLAIRRKMKTR